MGNLNLLFLVAAVADGSFLSGLLHSVGAPTSAESAGVAVGSLLLYLLSQFVQGGFRRRQLKRIVKDAVTQHIAAHQAPPAQPNV